MRFNITYNDSENNRDGQKPSARRTVNKSLKVFVDQEDKEPRENRCQQSYLSPEVFFVHPTQKGSPVFDS